MGHCSAQPCRLLAPAALLCFPRGLAASPFPLLASASCPLQGIAGKQRIKWDDSKHQFVGSPIIDKIYLEQVWVGARAGP